MKSPTTPNVLEKADLFRGLERQALVAAAACASRISVRSGEQLLKQGDPPLHLFLVERGRIKMSAVSQGGTEVTLRFMQEGDIIGCAAVFRDMPYPASGTAIDDTSVVVWSASQFNTLVRRFPALAANALRIVSGRAEEFLQRLRETATERVEQRIARALLRYAATDPHASKDGPIGISRQQLADIANASIYTVSRTISAWAKQGLITAGRGHITIRDHERLTMIAGFPRKTMLIPLHRNQSAGS
jgi:CRP-like cAMP-binding protein